MNFDRNADPALGVLSSVLSTGQLRIIRNQDLRAALVRWDAAFSDLRGAEDATQEMNDRGVIPFLEQHMAFRSVISTSVDADLGPSAFAFDVQEVLGNREFESVIANRVVWVEVVVKKYDAVLAGLDRTRAPVNAELEARH